MKWRRTVGKPSFFVFVNRHYDYFTSSESHDMQHEIIHPLPLLDDKGHIVEEGWARQPYWSYNRNHIKAPWYRIKEWDYYSVFSAEHQYGITITFSDLGYIGLMAVCFLDLKKGYCHQVEELTILPKGQSGLTADSDVGTIRFKGKKLSITYKYEDGKRLIQAVAPGMIDSEGRKGLQADILLHQPADLESMNIATSWKENRKAFYYNRKINCMPAEGIIQIGNKNYTFTPDKDFGALDWGRGVWTYKNRWFWGSASGYIDGESFGFNIGYGFSDRSPASENMLFYKGMAHKLEEVQFHFDAADYLQPWTFSSSDGRLEMNFLPAVDRSANLNLGIIKTVQHQVFGYFTGKAVLDDGTTLTIQDLPGFAEDVLNWW